MNNIKTPEKFVDCEYYKKSIKSNDSQSNSKKLKKRKEKSEIRANKRAVHFMQQD